METSHLRSVSPLTRISCPGSGPPCSSPLHHVSAVLFLADPFRPLPFPTSSSPWIGGDKSAGPDDAQSSSFVVRPLWLCPETLIYANFFTFSLCGLSRLYSPSGVRRRVWYGRARLPGGFLPHLVRFGIVPPGLWLPAHSRLKVFGSQGEHNACSMAPRSFSIV